jgi:hypothetical protein
MDAPIPKKKKAQDRRNGGQDNSYMPSSAIQPGPANSATTTRTTAASGWGNAKDVASGPIPKKARKTQDSGYGGQDIQPGLANFTTTASSLTTVSTVQSVWHTSKAATGWGNANDVASAWGKITNVE